jgi:hypothetical protein
VRAFFHKHLEHLPLLPSGDATRGPPLLPVREPRILRLDRLEASTLERRRLGVLNRVLDGTLISSQQLRLVLVVRPPRSRSRTSFIRSAVPGSSC